MLKELINKAIQEGGLTYDVKNDFYPSSGFVVSVNKEREVIVKRLTEKEVLKYIAMNYDYLNTEKYCFGIWRNEGQYYLDVTMIFNYKEEAIYTAQRNNQKAIYDLENDKEIPVEQIEQFDFDDLENEIQNEVIRDFFDNDDGVMEYAIETLGHMTFDRAGNIVREYDE